MIRRSSGNSRFATFGLLVLVLLLAVAPTGPVIGGAGLGHGFYGTVKLDGEDAAVGTVVSARVGGTEYGSGTVETAGQYALVVQGDIDEGATVDFYVSGRKTDQTHPFHSGWTTPLDLTATTPTYTLTMAADPEAGGNATDETGMSPYPEGAIVDIKAEAEEGYEFVNWTSDPQGIIDDEDAQETFLTMPGENVAVTASFEEVPTGDLTLTSEAGGSFTATIDEEETLIEAGQTETISDVAEGTEVDLVAAPADGYRFIEWGATAGELDDAEKAETTFIMPDEDATVTANFVGVYALNMTANPEAGGTAVDVTGDAPYTAGTTVNITAVPEQGYQFVNWTSEPEDIIDDEQAEQTFLIMPAEDVTVIANFQLQPVLPTVTTQAATDITIHSAVVSMTYTTGNFTSVDVRFSVKRAADVTWLHDIWVSRTEDGTYAYGLMDLAANTEYEFKAQLRYNDTVIEGDVRRFITASQADILFPPFCFIATAAYGTPNAEQIDVLREFRDVVLAQSSLGSRFVTLYYQLSPPVAEVISENGFLRTLTRDLLVDPVVRIVQATGHVWRK